MDTYPPTNSSVCKSVSAAANGTRSGVLQSAGVFSIVLVAFCWAAPTALAETASYKIDQVQSFLRIVPGVFSGFEVVSGTKFANTFAVTEQTPGSLETKLGGALTADVAGSTLTFTGGSVIDALPNPAGPFLPSVAGSPGVEDNYGGNAEIAFGSDLGDLAVRDAMADIVSGSATVGGLATGLEFDITSGILDHDVPDPGGLGFLNLPVLLSTAFNQSTTVMSGSVDGTIQIAFDLSFDFDLIDPPGDNDSRMVMEGLLVATRFLPGDFDEDDDVDGDDFLKWQRGETEDPFSAAELAAWEANYGAAQLQSAVKSVPEPSSVLLPLSGLMMIFLGPRSRKPLRNQDKTHSRRIDS